MVEQSVLDTRPGVVDLHVVIPRVAEQAELVLGGGGGLEASLGPGAALGPGPGSGGEGPGAGGLGADHRRYRLRDQGADLSQNLGHQV